MSALAEDAAPADLWYLAALSSEVKPGAMERKLFFGEPVVLGRTKSGEAFAMKDVCPHRAAPLSGGRIVEEGEPAVECPYHGWRFATKSGACSLIPALPSYAQFDAAKIKVRRYPLHEANGLIWIYWAADGREAPPACEPPETGLPADWRPRITVRVGAEGPFDETVIGLVDPAHTPFVHRQWWWREGAGLKDKTKTFEPTPLGFKMPAHRPSSNSRIYKFFGGAPTTEIEFRLPGVRLETIRLGKRTVLGLTAMTPTEDGKTDIVHVIFWDIALLTLLHPIAQKMTESFLGQDGAILRAQNENLARAAHRPLYVGDPDEPAKWYVRLKRAWMARDASAPFVNPIAGGTLHWRT
ncbi:MAG: aromatic ring-hydroxylating dioxygenase subunit alpha [Parvularculaceae bacterium]|nr:aromatic ring-hydroxylating dioxygenase subunit alpha [Caulobacterales bacterium]